MDKRMNGPLMLSQMYANNTLFGFKQVINVS